MTKKDRYYLHIFKCSNCEQDTHIKIPKGQKKYEHFKMLGDVKPKPTMTKCVNCECEIMILDGGVMINEEHPSPQVPWGFSDTTSDTTATNITLTTGTTLPRGF